MNAFERSSHLAEDVTQETFLSVYRNLKLYDPSKLFSPWLFTIAKYAAYKVIKGRAKVVRIMAMIEKEPVYAESPEALAQYKQAAVPRAPRFFGRHFKKIAIAAALIFGLGQ